MNYEELKKKYAESRAEEQGSFIETASWKEFRTGFGLEGEDAEDIIFNKNGTPQVKVGDTWFFISKKSLNCSPTASADDNHQEVFGDTSGLRVGYSYGTEGALAGHPMFTLYRVNTHTINP